MWENEYYRLKKLRKLDILLSLLSDNIRESEDPDINKIMIYYKITYESLKKKYGDVIPEAKEYTRSEEVFRREINGEISQINS
jgi:hypothetical protein